MNKQGLVKKVIVNKLGHRQKVWVKLYHGSDHKFDKFKVSKLNEKILKGLSVMGFGKGFYLTEIKDIADNFGKGGYRYETEVKNKDKMINLSAHHSTYPNILKSVKENIENNPKAFRNFNFKKFQKDGTVRDLIELWKPLNDYSVNNLLKGMKYRGVYIKEYADDDRNTVVAFYPNDITIKSIKKL